MTQNELMHYGVQGMKWGIRRYKPNLYSEDKGIHNNAVAKLTTHREKANKKLSKLENQASKLNDKRSKQIATTDKKVAELRYKADKNRKKAHGFLANEISMVTREHKARQLDYKASVYEKRAADTKAKIEKNKRMQEAFKKGIDEINNELITKGQDFLYMREDGYPYMY